MKAPLFLSIVICAGFILYSRCADPVPKATSEKNKADSSVSQAQNDSISDLEKHYEKHNNEAQ